MLVIAGRIRLDPAKLDAAVTAVKQVMLETRQEPGCISYTFSADLSEADPEVRRALGALGCVEEE